MIKNCPSAVRAFGVALLIAGIGQAYAQHSRGLESQALRIQSDACTGVGLPTTPAVCRAAGEPASSKYNLLYADDAPADEGTDEGADEPPLRRQARSARNDAYRGDPRDEATGS